MTSHLAAVPIETHTARLETEPSHLPNLYIPLVGKVWWQDNHWASDRHLWMPLTSFSSALSEQNILTRQFCLTLHLKVFRVSDYCSLGHFLYIGTGLIQTPRGHAILGHQGDTPYWDTKRHAKMGHHGDTPYWNTKETRHTGTPRGHTTLRPHGDTPYWNTKGTSHTGTPWGHAILEHQGDTPYWNTKGTRHTGTPWGHAILEHQGDTPYWDPMGTHHTGTPRGHAILGHHGDTPYWDTKGTRHTGTPRGQALLGHHEDKPNSVRRNEWSKKPRKWNLCKRKRKPLWKGNSTRVKHRRKGGLKIKHASHYFATVSSNKIVLIRNLQVTRGYENKLI